ncbi:UNVERIFIED_CONTAM: hypothetical protein K2H54_011996 [Gekko kuhli]
MYGALFKFCRRRGRGVVWSWWKSSGSPTSHNIRAVGLLPDAPSHQPQWLQQNRGRGRRRLWIVFTGALLDTLARAFGVNRHPDFQFQEALARRIEVPESRVQHARDLCLRAEGHVVRRLGKGGMNESQLSYICDWLTAVSFAVDRRENRIYTGLALVWFQNRRARDPCPKKKGARPWSQPSTHHHHTLTPPYEDSGERTEEDWTILPLPAGSY